MRKLVVGIVMGLAVLGLGAAAFAVGGETGTTHAGDTTTTSTSTTTTTTVVPELDGGQLASAPTTSDDGKGVERSTEGCDGGTYENHGAYVSSVAHDPDRKAGDVPEAAKSDCGKPVSATGEPDESEPETEATESSSGSTSNGKGNSNGNGSSSGRGNGKGNGKP